MPDEGYKKLLEKDQELVLDIFEEVFDHKSFTGRSGTFFGYEGLGSIYWHMVSKLLLAVQETSQRAIDENESDEVVSKLIDHYHEIYEGIGVHKSPKLYGAFPTDPYSHTPAEKGAKQPGMTGQVKEDLLSRLGELGVHVKEGKLCLDPNLLQRDEFLQEQSLFNYFDVHNTEREITIDKDSLCFTYCQVPIIYQIAEKNKLQIHFADKTMIIIENLQVDKVNSTSIFERTGKIEHIKVFVIAEKLK